MDPKRNILFILPSAQCGGAENVVVNVANNINKSAYKSALLFIDDEGPIIEKVSHHISIYTLKRKRVSRSIVLLLKKIRTINPDIILTSIFHLNVALIILKLFLNNNKKVIIRESNILSIVLLREKFPRLFAILVRFFYPKADVVVSLGSEMKHNLTTHFKVPSWKILTIGNPIDLAHIQTASIGHQNPFDNTKFNFLAAGSLTLQKGFDIIIEAMALVAKECDNIHLSILGDGPLKDELSHLIHQRGLSHLISLCGFKENPYPYFFHANRFVLSSRYEGLPNVVLEALALGTPVIALDNPGCLRDIITNKKQGILVKPCTAIRLADEMLKARIEPSETKESLLPEKFLIENVIKRYEELFESV